MDVKDMNRIHSFSLDHDVMEKGLYRNMHAHGVTTWDLRFKTPNAGDYVTPKAAHTIEHIIATVLRNSERKSDIIYFGPMGCRTGFYLLTVNMEYFAVLRLLKECFQKALEFTAIPGSEKKECGNYLEHDLDEGLKEIKEYLTVLEGLS